MGRINIQDRKDNNVSLLLPFDNDLKDYSKNNFPITVNGNAQISTDQSKFGGSSAYFEGNGDYLILENNEALSFNTGFNNSPNIPFTIESWIYPTVVDSTNRVIISKDTFGSNFSWCLAFSNTIILCYTHNINNDWQFEASASVRTNTWQHIAVTSDGTTQRLFLNGTLLGSKNAVITNASSKITIGCAGWNNPNGFYQGYINDLRVTKGIALYTSNFTPPKKLLRIGKINNTYPYFNTTILQLPFDNSLNDITNKFTITKTGTGVEISTAQSKFGKTSVYFNGIDGNYLDANPKSIINNAPIDFFTKDFTIEAWIRPANKASSTIINTQPHNVFGFGVNYLGNQKISFICGDGITWISPLIVSSTNISFDTWFHVAVVRSENRITMYHNGVPVGSTDIMPGGVFNFLRIGAITWNGGFNNETFSGYINDFRAIQFAKYKNNFRPPSTIKIMTYKLSPNNLFAFWKLNETSGTRYDSSGNGRNLTEAVGTVLSTTGKVGACAYFNGANGGGSTNSRLGSTSFGVNPNSDFSCSVWIKPRSFSGHQHIIGAPFANGFYIGANGPQFGSTVGYNLTFNLYNGTTWGISAPTTDFDTWHHYVFIRDRNTLKLYADNIYIGSTSVAGQSFAGVSKFSVGGGENNEYYFNGDIDAMGIWTRVLTTAEISNLYNKGNGLEL